MDGELLHQAHGVAGVFQPVSAVHIARIEHGGQRLASGRAVQVDALILRQRRQVGGDGGGQLAAAHGADDLFQVVEVKTVEDIDRWFHRVAEVQAAVPAGLSQVAFRHGGAFLARAQFEHGQRLAGGRVETGPVAQQVGQGRDFHAGQGR